MKILLAALICLLCSCQSPPLEKADGRIFPQNWSGNRPPAPYLLSEAEYVAAAKKHAEAKYGTNKIPASPIIKLFYPDVPPEKQIEFPVVLAHLELKRVEGKEFDTVSLIAIYMASDSSLIQIEQTELDERITSKHGAPW